MASSQAEVIQYLVDTRTLWPNVRKTDGLKDDAEASRALDLLSAEEQKKVTKYLFVADAKMALASQLLKRWVVSKYAGVPWDEVTISAGLNGKPIYVTPDGNNKQPVVFNVSHQAGLVALAAVVDHSSSGEGNVDVGVDIVCVSERQARDREMIRKEGWAHFVDMHAEVFGRSEAGYLKNGLADRLNGLRTEEARTAYRLRAFYTLWCLREAYVKMTGEALLAPWLGDLIFDGFEPPEPGTAFEQREEEDDDENKEVIRTHNVVFKGKRVDDANICLRSLGPDYMTCTAVRTPSRKEDALGWKLGPFKFITVDEIVEHATTATY
ncbi:phosphopantetheinyl transferase [Xylariaceae sp. FL0594]|nr:phosphopantetheinyl transferase [Xylariaceae sp. FL0594]